MLDLEDAKKLCDLLPADSPSPADRYGAGTSSNKMLLETLKRTFPEIPWRIILCRDGEYTRWAFSVLADDPREHYVQESRGEPSGRCIHCGKTGAELGLPVRDDF